METLTTELEMSETVHKFQSPCQESCNIIFSDKCNLSSLVETTEPPIVCKDSAQKYWIPAPDEDQDLVFTCMNCDLNLESNDFYYESQICFNCYCRKCYSSGVHSDKICITLNVSTKLDTSCSSSNSEYESWASSCSTDEDSTIIQLGVT